MRGLVRYINIAFPVLLLCLAAGGGCRFYGPERAGGSGFIGGPEDYARMEQVKGFLRKAAYAWARPGVDWKSYNNVHILPVKVRFLDPAESALVAQEDIDRLRQAFYNALTQELGQKYPVVAGRGAGVLVIDPCLTQVQPNKAARNAALAVAGLPSVFSGSVAVEMVFYDGQSGQRVATFMDTKAGETSGLRHMLTDAYTKWGNIESAFIAWARELRKVLDRAHNL